MASISWLRSMIAATKAKISKNEDSIGRLKTAKKQMADVKDEFQYINLSVLFPRLSSLIAQLNAALAELENALN